MSAQQSATRINTSYHDPAADSKGSSLTANEDGRTTNYAATEEGLRQIIDFRPLFAADLLDELTTLVWCFAGDAPLDHHMLRDNEPGWPSGIARFPALGPLALSRVSSALFSLKSCAHVEGFATLPRLSTRRLPRSTLYWIDVLQTYLSVLRTKVPRMVVISDPDGFGSLLKGPRRELIVEGRLMRECVKAYREVDRASLAAMSLLGGLHDAVDILQEVHRSTAPDE